MSVLQRLRNSLDHIWSFVSSYEAHLQSELVAMRSLVTDLETGGAMILVLVVGVSLSEVKSTSLVSVSR